MECTGLQLGRFRPSRSCSLFASQEANPLSRSTIQRQISRDDIEGGDYNMNGSWLSIQLRISPSQLTSSFFRSTTNQYWNGGMLQNNSYAVSMPKWNGIETVYPWYLISDGCSHILTFSIITTQVGGLQVKIHWTSSSLVKTSCCHAGLNKQWKCRASLQQRE